MNSIGNLYDEEDDPAWQLISALMNQRRFKRVSQSPFHTRRRARDPTMPDGSHDRAKAATTASTHHVVDLALDGDETDAADDRVPRNKRVKRASTSGSHRAQAPSAPTIISRALLFDDFTSTFVSNEALDASGADELRRASVNADEALRAATETELLTQRDPPRIPRANALERIVRGILRRRRGSKKGAEVARGLVRLLRFAERLAPATRLRSDGESSATVEITPEAWTIASEAREYTTGAFDASRRASVGGSASQRAQRALERDFSSFVELLERVAYAGVRVDARATRRSGRNVETDAREASGQLDEETDDDSTSESESDATERDEANDNVGAQLLFLHASAMMRRDVRIRIRALGTYKARGDVESAAALARNAMVYKLFVDGAPTEGDRSAALATLVDVACLAGERIGRAHELFATDDEDQPMSRASTTPRAHSRVVTDDFAIARDVAGAEDCGVNEISSAARDILEGLVRLLDEIDAVSDDASSFGRRHTKVRTQIDDAYAEAWKCAGRARLQTDDAKRVFAREFRDRAHGLLRFRDALARRVERRHAPGIFEGGVGGADGSGAAHVLNYVADDVVRAIKSHATSEGASDYVGAFAALGAAASASTRGALRLEPSGRALDAALKRCVEAFALEAERSDAFERVSPAIASFALARAFVSGA